MKSIFKGAKVNILSKRTNWCFLKEKEFKGSGTVQSGTQMMKMYEKLAANFLPFLRGDVDRQRGRDNR